MTTPTPAPPAAPQGQSPLVSLASKFSVAGLIRLLTTTAGLVISAETPFFTNQPWFTAAVAVAAGLGIYAVHNPPAKGN